MKTSDSHGSAAGASYAPSRGRGVAQTRRIGEHEMPNGHSAMAICNQRTPRTWMFEN